ncbi:hypothetical protein [Desulfatirhabdium butyrativorans]|uniref:hypothetical protein n=1 Tax=Desulfatirhabdium butyrativorans TaxID=340467 RepID=UPI00048A233A|nr:hypothetical protein [Desulfatirhabdium butyrativorans]
MSNAGQRSGVRLSPEDRLAIVKPLRTVIQRLAVAGFLVACAFYGATLLPPRLFWLSPLCFVLAGIRILTLTRR